MSKVLHFLFFEAFPYSYLEFHLNQIRGQQDIGLDIQAQGLVSSVSQPPKYSSGLNPKIVFVYIFQNKFGVCQKNLGS